MPKLVLIDTKKNLYKYYEGREHVHTIHSDGPLNAAYVEEFRKDARNMIKEMDDWDGEDPDNDLVA